MNGRNRINKKEKRKKEQKREYDYDSIPEERGGKNSIGKREYGCTLYLSLFLKIIIVSFFRSTVIPTLSFVTATDD